jgi:hypothetical protein
MDGMSRMNGICGSATVEVLGMAIACTHTEPLFLYTSNFYPPMRYNAPPS